MEPVLDPISQFIVKFFAACLVCSGCVFIISLIILTILIMIIAINPKCKLFNNKRKIEDLFKAVLLGFIPLANIVIALAWIGYGCQYFTDKLGSAIANIVYNRHLKHKSE